MTSPGTGAKRFSLSDKVGALVDYMPRKGLLSNLLYVPLDTRNMVPGDAINSRLAALRTEAASDQASGFNYASELKHRAAPHTIGDEMHWKPELHGPNSTAGVVVTDAIGPARYGVVVHTGSGEVGENLCEFAAANKTMTIGDFISSPEFLTAQSYAERNARRLAADIGACLVARPSMPVHSVMEVSPDMLAAPAHKDAAVTTLANPTVHIRYNTLVPHPRDCNSVVFLSGYGAPYDSRASGSMLWQRDHLEGFALDKCGADVPSRPVTPVHYHAVQEDNFKYNSLKGDRENLRRHVQNIYLTTDGKPATSAAPVLWSTSEVAAPIPSPSLTLLRPVAMVVHAKPARAVVE